MNRKQLRSMKVVCSRCKRRVRGDKADGWNIEAKQGRFVGHICPKCQTPEENAEAEINAATLDYSRAKPDAFGVLRAPAKVESVLTTDLAAEMSCEELIKACAAQIDLRHPNVTDDEFERRTIELYASVASQKHSDEITEMSLREAIQEAEQALVSRTAERLASPDVDDNGMLRGVVAFVDEEGAHSNISLTWATPEYFERAYYVHTRKAYLAISQLLRRHGLKTYREAYEAGVLGELLDGGEPHAS